MSRLGDVLYFLRQIFFPNWTDRENNAEPTAWQKFLAGLFLFLTSRNGTGAVFSIVLHTFLFVLLALIAVPQLGKFTGIDILGGVVPFPGEQAVLAPPQTGESDDNDTQQNPIPEESDAPAQEQPVAPLPTPSPALPDDSADDSADQISEAERWKIQSVGGFSIGGGFQNRNAAGRQRALQGGGSSRGSEAAVEAALAWLAHHQQRDGGWSLHFDDSCQRCSQSGTSLSNRRTAATALALLPFLGAGYSHQTPSPYRETVEKGLRFLIQNPNGGIDAIATKGDTLRMYSHGLAAIALCEAYAMTKDQNPKSRLGMAAQDSLWFIETAQDPDYGGWNYRPDQLHRNHVRVRGDTVRIGGDTSIFAWQLMALKSGKIGNLYVSQSVLYAAQDFLDSVAWNGGRQYLYVPTGDWYDDRGIDSPQTCTAIGLLMRMYLGWKPGNPILDGGMNLLVQWGYTPRAGECNLYYAYYATLALHHYGGEHWEPWNSGLQEMLVRIQSREGCESGSWHFRDPYCDVGGRLLSTALAAMILETPYRIMPLYREMR